MTDQVGETRGRALVAFDNALVRLAAAGRDPSAWEEGNLRDALAAMSSGDYKHALEKISSALRLPTPADVATITSRNLLNRAQLRDRFDDVVLGGGYVRSNFDIA
jgi:hypothetical protein